MLKNKIILVTGASSGIGATIAKHCARKGAYVFLGCHAGIERAEKILDEIHKSDGVGEVISFDVNDYKKTQEAVKKVVASKKEIHGLVHCAGINMSGPLIGMTEEDIRKQIDTGLSGAIILSQAVLQPMIAKRFGSIVHMSSVAAHRMVRGHSVYSAAKAGLEGFTKALAAEVAKRSVRVNCIIPGPVKTPMLEKSMKETGEDPSQRVPMGRLIEAQEVADACEFLLSDKSQGITGTAFPVDGGYLLW